MRIKWTRKTIVEFQEEQKTIEAWSEYTGISCVTLLIRLKDPNWTIEDALTLPPTYKKENSRLITFNGVSKPLSVWAEEIGITPDTLKKRIDVLGWTLPEALNISKRNREAPVKVTLLTYKGKTQSVSKWAKETGLPRKAIYRRLQQSGWTVEDALSTPMGKQNNQSIGTD